MLDTFAHKKNTCACCCVVKIKGITKYLISYVKGKKNITASYFFTYNKSFISVNDIIYI